MSATVSPQAPGTPLSETERAAVHSSRGQAFVITLLLILASLGLYNPVGKHPFVNYDDARYVSDNSHVREGFTRDSIRWAFTTYDESNWHPLTWLSHMLDIRLFQLNPAGHHYTNAILHALNAAVLFWVLYAATGFLWRSSMVAFLFALHPINVESVAWVAERKNLLSLLFFLLALGAYRWYAARPRVGRYALVALLFALGLMAKPQVITLPFVLLLWDYWPLQRTSSSINQDSQAKRSRAEIKPWYSLVLEKLPLFAMCVASSVLTLRAQTAAGAVTSFHRYPLSIRLENGVVAYARYLGKALWPSNLAVMYPYQPASLTASQIFLSTLLLILISALVIAAGRRRFLAVGWLWFLGTLIPMIGVVQVGVQAMADRYAYLPFIGLFIAVVWSAAELLGKRVPAAWMAAVSVILLAALAFLSHRQIAFWSSDLALWSHAAAVTSGNFVAEDGIGNALLEQGDLEQAIPHFKIAAAIHPTDPISNSNIAFYKMQHGDLQGALRQYQTVLDNTVDERSKANALMNMAAIDDQLKDFESSRENYQAATALRPRNVRAWIGFGVAAQKSGKSDAAIDAYSHAVEIQPSDLTYLLLAGALKQAGRDEAAASAANAAKQFSQNLAQTQRFINSLLAR